MGRRSGLLAASWLIRGGFLAGRRRHRSAGPGGRAGTAREGWGGWDAAGAPVSRPQDGLGVLGGRQQGGPCGSASSGRGCARSSVMRTRAVWPRIMSWPPWGERTVDQALADGVDAKAVWRAVCEEFDVPQKPALSSASGPRRRCVRRPGAPGAGCASSRHAIWGGRSPGGRVPSPRPGRVRGEFSPGMRRVGVTVEQLFA